MGRLFGLFTVALPPTLFPSFGVLSFNSALSGLLVNTIIAYLVFLGYMLIKKGSSQRVDDPEDESRGVVTIFVPKRCPACHYFGWGSIDSEASTTLPGVNCLAFLAI